MNNARELYRQTWPRYRLVLFLLVIPCLMQSCGSTQNCPPVSWWKANGNANDSVGNNHGSLLNGATAAAPGVSATAFGLDGVDDIVLIPNAATLNPGTAAFTIRAWAKTSFTSGSTNRVIVSKMSVGSDIQYALAYKPTVSGLASGVPFFAVGNGSQTFSAESTQSIADGNWRLLCGVRDGVNLYLYVDGVLQAHATTPTVLNLGSGNNVVIGGRQPVGNPAFFNGSVDEVKFYLRALSVCEVQP